MSEPQWVRYRLIQHAREEAKVRKSADDAGHTVLHDVSKRPLTIQHMDIAHPSMVPGLASGAGTVKIGPSSVPQSSSDVPPKTVSQDNDVLSTLSETAERDVKKMGGWIADHLDNVFKFNPFMTGLAEKYGSWALIGATALLLYITLSK